MGVLMLRGWGEEKEPESTEKDQTVNLERNQENLVSWKLSERDH